MIEFVEVSFSYHLGASAYRQVVENLSFRVREREIVALLGPSGCGKSTIARLAVGLLQSSSGKVTRGNSRESAQAPCLTGYVPQGSPLFPWLSVRDNVKMMAAQGYPGHASVDVLLDRVGIAAARDLYPSQLSGGMRQRVSLARVLALSPPSYVLDEPFGSLDGESRYELQLLFRDALKQTAAGCLFVTHDPLEALLVGDRVLFARGTPVRSLCEFSVPWQDGASNAIRGRAEYWEFARRLIDDPSGATLPR